MTPEEIKLVFDAEIKKRGVASKVPTISKFTVYRWRQEQATPSLGDMIEVLYFLGKIKIKKSNESN
jgi:hypothetical protein